MQGPDDRADATDLPIDTTPPTSGTSRLPKRPFDPRVAAIYACGAVVALLVFAIAFSFAASPDDRKPVTEIGSILSGAKPGAFKATTLPDAGLVTMTGEVTSLPVVTAGRPALINLFANWCTACRLEMPALEKLHRQLGDQVQVVGVDQGDSHDVTATFVASTGASYTIVRDPQSLLVNRLAVTGLPLSVWVDARGRVVGHTYGAMTAAEMRGQVKRHFGIELNDP